MFSLRTNFQGACAVSCDLTVRTFHIIGRPDPDLSITLSLTGRFDKDYFLEIEYRL